MKNECSNFIFYIPIVVSELSLSLHYFSLISACEASHQESSLSEKNAEIWKCNNGSENSQPNSSSLSLAVVGI